MTQLTDAPPPGFPPPGPPPEQQWTDWGMTQASAGGGRGRKFFRPAVLVPLALLVGLIVLGGLFLAFASPAGAAGLCGGG